jgi:hypothetical protein
VSVLYYALGGGHGHVLRGLAVLSRLGHGTLLGPPALAPWAAALGVRYVSPPAKGAREWFDAMTPPSLLVVDVFPRGGVAELTPLLERVPAAWLVARRVREDYYLHPPVRAAIESRYERVVWCEAPPAALAGLRVASTRLDPVLLRPDALDRVQARRRLGVAPGARLILALGSGEAERQRLLCRLLGKIASRQGAALRFVSSELPPVSPVVALFPAAASLRAADVVVTAAGYHAAYETALAGVPTVFVPQARAYDDQRWRARERVRAADSAAATAGDPPALEAAIARLLRDGRRQPARLGDGAAALARLIERRVELGVLAQEEVAPVA